MTRKMDTPFSAAVAAASVHRRRQVLRDMGAWCALGASAWVWPMGAQAQGTVAPTRAAQRLVVLGGALTEVVYLLGAEPLLVGTDTTSLFPEAARRTPKVGYMRQLSAEGLLSLRPDCVLGTDEAGPRVVLEQVRRAGVRIELVPASHNWAEVQRKVAVVGQVVGRETAARTLQAQLDAEWSRVQQQVAAAPRPPRALFILSHGGSPMVAGTGTAADALIRYAGGVNAVTGFAGYRPWTAEALAEAAPEVLLNTTQGIEAMGGEAAFWQRAELALTPAFARKALVAMDANHLLGFGPRLPAVVQALHTRMRGLVA